MVGVGEGLVEVAEGVGAGGEFSGGEFDEGLGFDELPDALVHVGGVEVGEVGDEGGEGEGVLALVFGGGLLLGGGLAGGGRVLGEFEEFGGDLALEDDPGAQLLNVQNIPV